MLENKDYCDHETAFGLIALGYPGSALILLYSAQKWLREEKQMVLYPAYLGGANVWICEICYKKERLGFRGYNQSYEEALSEGIKDAVKILKEK